MVDEERRSAPAALRCREKGCRNQWEVIEINSREQGVNRMALRDLREFIAALGNEEVHQVMARVDPTLEIAAITDQVCKEAGTNKALLFRAVRGSTFAVSTNLFGSAERLAMALGISRLGDLSTWFAALLDQLPGASASERLSALADSEQWQKAAPRLVATAPWQEHTAPLDLGLLPILKSWPGDGHPDHDGHFLTLPLVITTDPSRRELNCGMYRAAVLGPDRLAIQWGERSGGAAHAAAWRKQGEPMPVAIALGGDPVLTFAATLPLPRQLDEFTFAGLLRGEPLDLSTTPVGLPVPAGAELVLQGWLQPGDEAFAGAFANHTGYYTPRAKAPLVRITAIQHREDMIFPATVVGRPPMEDCWLARGAERLFLPLLQLDQPAVVEISQPLAGIFHGATVVAMNKTAPGEGRRLLQSLWATPWLARARLLVVVDSGQDPADYQGVCWRALNNSDWTRDLLVAHDRLGIDATRKWGAELADRPTRFPLEAAPAMVNLVKQRWQEYGFRQRSPA